MSPWNGICLMETGDSALNLVLNSDAAGSWGCGAWHGTDWFQYHWIVSEQHLDISTKELFSIVVAAAIWGPQWRGAKVTCFCYNQAVVSVMHSHLCQDKQLMHLL